MSLLDHLGELRRRILYSLGFLFAAFFACWTWARPIFRFLKRPIDPLLAGEKLAFTAPTDVFVLYVKVSLLASIFLSSPFILYQAWRFIAPGLYRRERRWALPFVLAGTLFFCLGGAFAYYVAFPFALDFLLGLGEDFRAVITVDRYFRFLITIILGLGLMFELPVIIFLLAQIGLVTPGFLLRQFRWAVLLIFIAAALITPTPDVVNLCLFAVPAIGLYLVGVGAALVVDRSRRRRRAREAEEMDEALEMAEHPDP